MKRTLLTLILIIVILVVVYQKLGGNSPNVAYIKPPCHPSDYEYASDLPSHNDQGEYLNIVTDVLTTSDDKQSHQDYVVQRELHGDQTRRLYQVSTPTNTRFIGRRPPSPVSDPYSPQQLGITYNNSDGKWVKW